jgi:Restriction endonuclease
MGTLVATYSERDDRFYKIGQKIELKPDGVRRLRASPLRYCLGANYIYLARDQEAAMSGRLCWARIPTHLTGDYKFDFGDEHEGRGEPVSGIKDLENAGVMIGDRYSRRWREENGSFVPVPEFCSQELLDALAENPEALPAVSHENFESLCAEVFARRGFKVDLFRGSSDGGIDFLALQDERTDPLIMAVQVKQPDEREVKPRRSVGRPVLQQIYGAAKAWDLKGGILISGSTYSRAAKAFAELKPAEMRVYNGQDVLDWITRYRWNEDELL